MDPIDNGYEKFFQVFYSMEDGTRYELTNDALLEINTTRNNIDKWSIPQFSIKRVDHDLIMDFSRSRFSGHIKTMPIANFWALMVLLAPESLPYLADGKIQEIYHGKVVELRGKQYVLWSLDKQEVLKN